MPQVRAVPGAGGVLSLEKTALFSPTSNRQRLRGDENEGETNTGMRSGGADVLRYEGFSLAECHSAD